MASKRILIVEDNVDSGTTLQMVLNALGHDVQFVPDGESAMPMVPRFRPQIVILDLGLPGMQGHEAARRLRELDKQGKMVIIALSGWGRESDVESSKAAGIDRHLVKPLDLEALKQAIGDLPDSGPDS
jgi:CheY-like chemotaxis protein